MEIENIEAPIEKSSIIEKSSTEDEIPKLLEENDILLKIEEGTNNTTSTTSHKIDNNNNNPLNRLEQYIHLRHDSFDYDSED